MVQGSRSRVKAVLWWRVGSGDSLGPGALTKVWSSLSRLPALGLEKAGSIWSKAFGVV